MRQSVVSCLGSSFIGKTFYNKSVSLPYVMIFYIVLGTFIEVF